LVAVIGTYLLLGVIAYWPVLPGISGRLSSLDGDLTLTAWFFGWVPHALAHGLNPFFSNAMFVPTGLNLAQNTEGPLLGLAMAPVTLVFSPLVTANLLMFLSMPVSATAAFVVFRKWQVWDPAAAIGGLVYGFSPYMVGQGGGHPVLMFVPLPPFIVLTVASMLQGRGSRRRLGIQLGLLVTAQYLISPEVLAVVGVLTFVAMACVVIRYPSAFPKMARAAAGSAVIAFALAAVLLAYPVWMLMAGPQHVAGSTYPLLNPFHNDVLSFVVHGPLQKVSLGMQSSWSGGLVNDPTEAGGYIGIPVVILVAFFAWRSRRSPRMQLTMVLLVVAAVLSLGPYLTVHGRATHIPLPFIVLGHLPLLDNLLPSRIAFEMDACLAAVIAFGLDDMRRIGTRNRMDRSPGRSWTRERKATAFAGLTLAILVATQLPVWPYATQRAVALPANLLRAIPTGDPVAVTYPYSYGTVVTQSMLWQADDGFSFRILGGYAFHPTVSGIGSVNPNPMSPPELQLFLVQQEFLAKSISSSMISTELVAATRTALSSNHVRLVIVDRSAAGSGPVMELFTDALGPPSFSAGQFLLWTDWHGALGR
jgi:hypothetical protein